jgi:hypothetical protein
MCSNISASPVYDVYISQLIRYARASSNYSDFLKRHLYLRNRLLDQGYKEKLIYCCTYSRRHTKDDFVVRFLLMLSFPSKMLYILIVQTCLKTNPNPEASSNYSDFLKRHLYLRNRLLDQGYNKIRLIRSLKKFIFRYQDLVEIYSVSAETIINEYIKVITQLPNSEQSNKGKVKTDKYINNRQNQSTTGKP